MVEEIVCLDSKLCVESFTDTEIFEERRVKEFLPLPTEGVTTQIPIQRAVCIAGKDPEGRRPERVRIKLQPLSPLCRRGRRVTHEHWSRPRFAEDYRICWTALNSYQTIDLKSAEEKVNSPRPIPAPATTSAKG